MTTGDDPLAAGRAALERGAWNDARGRFESALAAGGQTAEALEGLGMAAWWLQDGQATLDARERAYRLYHEAGDRVGAARMASWLADDHAWFRAEDEASAAPSAARCATRSPSRASAATSSPPASGCATSAAPRGGAPVCTTSAGGGGSAGS